MKKTKIDTVGHIAHGTTTTNSVEQAKKSQKYKPKEITIEDFEKEEDWYNFLVQTKPIPLRVKKIPKLPFTSLRDCLAEYNLIMEKKSDLSGTQMIMVKNIIHNSLRKGIIVLTIE